VGPQLPSELERQGSDSGGNGGSSSEEEDYLDPPSDDDSEQAPSDAQDQQLREAPPSGESGIAPASGSEAPGSAQPARHSARPAAGPPARLAQQAAGRKPAAVRWGAGALPMPHLQRALSSKRAAASSSGEDEAPVLVYTKKNPTSRPRVEAYKATQEARVRLQRQPSYAAHSALGVATATSPWRLRADPPLTPVR
jgi:hypothetical protein